MDESPGLRATQPLSKTPGSRELSVSVAGSGSWEEDPEVETRMQGSGKGSQAQHLWGVEEAGLGTGTRGQP